MENNNSNITFGEFVKIASDELGGIIDSTPLNIAEDAYNLYTSAPIEKLASIMDQLYESIEPGYDKIALDMISANLLKTAGLKDTIKSNTKKLMDKQWMKDTLEVINHPLTNLLYMGPMAASTMIDIGGTVGRKVFGGKKRDEYDEEIPQEPYIDGDKYEIERVR